ncbi:MAG: hypothetical protein COB53_01175 [Elusimicrobia bacterium]|nr:MAG: hypothetical protein COB53_01175 [Elusimicrobiota bacterium]
MKTLLPLLLLITAAPSHAKKLNGFNLDDGLIPANKIFRGGPPRDGIPALTDPKFVTANQTRLRPGDRVIGVYRNGVAKAYPIRILNWHEIVNDAFGKERIAITYCPLCGTGMVFHSRIEGKRRRFAVSGLLYNSDVLLYDRETDSLWSQIMKKSVTGPSKGQELRQLPSRHTTWKKWKKLFPKTLVQSFDTGFRRDYNRDPYVGYENDPGTYFPVGPKDKRLHPKEWVLGVAIGNSRKAYPVKKCSKRVIKDTLGGKQLEIHCDPKARSAYVRDSKGRELPSTQAYWFAWSSFYPQTNVYTR